MTFLFDLLVALELDLLVALGLLLVDALGLPLVVALGLPLLDALALLLVMLGFVEFRSSPCSVRSSSLQRFGLLLVALDLLPSMLGFVFAALGLSLQC